MASSKLLFTSILFLAIALHLVQSHRLLQSQQVLTTGMNKDETEAKGRAAYVTSTNCGGLCAVRCSKSSRPNLCKRACGTCCARCNCVPPGTYGNYNTCPCYATMTTRGGARKCP
uniref:Cold-regulated gibberellin-regulated protein 1 LTCOR12 n=1 Tax=Allium sativum TaxID=4682 RepID=H2CLW9_ALLSA|nr:cold-regulated gibberellin-regulated protein 1 LTCOR12 [Allium sativum]